MTPNEVLYQLFQLGQITPTEYLKYQELPSETIERIRKAIEKYEINRK